MTDPSYCLPRELRAGDTITWRRSFADYLASAGWALSYKLISAAAAHSFTGAADGDEFAVTVAASVTADWAAGNYTLVEYITKAAERHTLSQQNVRVLPDLAAASAGVDTRTHARKVLDAINAWLEAKPIWAGEVQHGERRIRDYPVADLLALRDRYAAMVANEDGGSKGLARRVLVRL